MQRVVRFGKIICREMLPSNDGNNINGPSVIKVPKQIRSPLGAYYLYFAHHSGTYIRLAYADNLVGPYKVYEPGTLRLADCPACTGHIASPDVHVDYFNGKIRMYFHGPAVAASGAQRSFVAESDDGLRFTPSQEILGTFYFRAFPRSGFWYALGKARLYRSTNGLTGFVPGPYVYGPPNLSGDQNAPGALRHAAVDIRGDQAFIYFSRQGDAPERILRGVIALNQPWTEWRVLNVVPVISPEEAYEGASLPSRVSQPSAAIAPENALRDPYVLVDNAKTFLFYSVAGEQGIALAEILIP